jgi:hypothetical protein
MADETSPSEPVDEHLTAETAKGCTTGVSRARHSTSAPSTASRD